MELIFELLLQLVGEVLVQALFEFGFRSLLEPFRKEQKFHKGLVLFAYFMLGLVGGALSLLLMPRHLIDNPIVQYANLAITPILLGLAFEWTGKYREAKGKQRMMLDRFSYGFVFALTMGLVRLVFAQ